MKQAGLVLGTVVVASLAGCAPPPPPPAPPPPPPRPPHLGPPQAARCDVVPFHVTDRGPVKISMSLNNDGGYCAATLTAPNGKPYDAPLVHELPLHGQPRVQKYDGKTSVEYVPEAGFTGTDHFTVRLIEKGVPGYTTLDVTAIVGAK